MITFSLFSLFYKSMELFDLNSYMADMVFEYLPNVKRVGSNKLNFRCPLCGDGKKSTSHRGWFYIDTGSYFCWNAGCPANDHGMPGLKFLSAITGKSIVEVKADLINRAGGTSKALYKNKIKKIGISLFNEDDDAEEEKKDKIISEKIDNGEWTEDLPKYALQYIENRKLLNATFLPKKYKFYFDIVHKRLVIPWSDEYYQERAILKSQSKEAKYMFPKEIEKPIFGLNNLDKNFKYIFLLEGVFDSIWVKNGLAVGSLTLSEHQKNILKDYENTYTIVYMPDNQFNDESSHEKSLAIMKENPYKDVFIWPKELKIFKDVNESTIKSDKFIKLWKSEDFLKSRIFNGVKGILEMTI